MRRRKKERRQKTEERRRKKKRRRGSFIKNKTKQKTPSGPQPHWLIFSLSQFQTTTKTKKKLKSHVSLLKLEKLCMNFIHIHKKYDQKI